MSFLEKWLYYSKMQEISKYHFSPNKKDNEFYDLRNEFSLLNEYFKAKSARNIASNPKKQIYY